MSITQKVLYPNGEYLAYGQQLLLSLTEIDIFLFDKDQGITIL